MKVLHISNELSWRGGENQIRLFVQESRKRGVQSAVAFPTGAKAIDRLKDIADVVELPSRAAFDPRSIIRLVKYCRENKIEILDAHSSGGMSLALSVKKRLPHLKLVVHRRTAFPIRQNWFSRNKYLNPLVDKYVCISGAIGDILLEYGIKKEKIVTVKSAIDESSYAKYSTSDLKTQWRKKFGIDANEVVIGCASALTEEKGHDTIIKACRILSDKKINFKCLIAGEGPLEDVLKNEVKLLQLDKNFVFTGFIKDIYGFLCALDVLMMPSRSEGLGTTLLEGAFAGCAIIGSRVGGIPEIIKQGETGLLFSVNDEIELAEGLEKLIGSQQLRNKLSEALKEHVGREFSLQKMVSGNIRVYELLMNK